MTNIPSAVVRIASLAVSGLVVIAVCGEASLAALATKALVAIGATPVLYFYGRKGMPLLLGSDEDPDD